MNIKQFTILGRIFLYRLDRGRRTCICTCKHLHYKWNFSIGQVCRCPLRFPYLNTQCSRTPQQHEASVGSFSSGCAPQQKTLLILFCIEKYLFQRGIYISLDNTLLLLDYKLLLLLYENLVNSNIWRGKHQTFYNDDCHKLI